MKVSVIGKLYVHTALNKQAYASSSSSSRVQPGPTSTPTAQVSSELLLSLCAKHRKKINSEEDQIISKTRQSGNTSNFIMHVSA